MSPGSHRKHPGHNLDGRLTPATPFVTRFDQPMMNSSGNKRLPCSSSEVFTKQQGESDHDLVVHSYRILIRCIPNTIMLNCRNSDALAQLVTDSRDFMGSIAKAKTARLSKPCSHISSPPHRLLSLVSDRLWQSFSSSYDSPDLDRLVPLYRRRTGEADDRLAG